MNRISEFRKSVNLTQQEFSSLLNLSQGALGHYEKGRRQPSLRTAHRIVQILNQSGKQCTLNDVFPAEN